MEKLEKKYNHVSKAVASFEQALLQHEKWETKIDPKKMEMLDIDYDGILLNLRDSTIQRFEYSIDLLWKYLKTYLDEKLRIVPDVLSPTVIIRHAGKARLLAEQETQMLLEMVKNRNLTSHIYQEEIAQILSGYLPSYLKTMKIVLDKVSPADSKL